MIICEDKKFVFVRNPKTATRSLTDFFLNNFNCLEIEKYHSIKIPPEYRKFTIYISIRNPLSRAVSAWKHVVSDGKKGLNKYAGITLSEYIENKKFSTTEEGFNFFYQEEILKELERHSYKLIYFEKLQIFLMRYFKIKSIKKLGISDGLNWNFFYQDFELYSKSLKVFEKDINRFKFYKKIYN